MHSRVYTNLKSVHAEGENPRITLAANVLKAILALRLHDDAKDGREQCKLITGPVYKSTDVIDPSPTPSLRLTRPSAHLETRGTSPYMYNNTIPPFTSFLAHLYLPHISLLNHLPPLTNSPPPYNPPSPDPAAPSSSAASSPPPLPLPLLLPLLPLLPQWRASATFARPS